MTYWKIECWDELEEKWLARPIWLPDGSWVYGVQSVMDAQDAITRERRIGERWRVNVMTAEEIQRWTP